MPRLWSATIEQHRREVRDAIVDATSSLAAQHGVLSVTMSQIAEAVGIGRATLYKYFPDVEAILSAWHERQISAHLDSLTRVRDTTSPGRRLEAVLEAFALISRERGAHDDADLVAFLHRDPELARPTQQLHRIIRELVIADVKAGDVRDDVSPDELTSYCLNAVAAARNLRSDAAVRRLVRVIVSGLKPPG